MNNDSESEEIGLVNSLKALVSAILLSLIGLILLAVTILCELQGQFSDLLKTAGTVLLSSGVVGIIYQLTMRRSVTRELKISLSSLLRSEFSTIQRLRDTGLSVVHDSLPTEEVKTAFSSAKKSIKILQTWEPHFTKLEKSLLLAAENQCEIQILLINPDSAHARERCQNLKHSNTAIITTTIEEVLRFRSNSKSCENIKIKIYDKPPALSFTQLRTWHFLVFF